MFKSLSFFLAKRYVGSRHGNGFATFISASSTVGIALGVMVLIVVLSAMNGFEKALAQKLLSIVPHGELVAVDEPLNNWPELIKNIEKQSTSITAAPVIKISGMMQHKTELKGVEVRGVDLALEQQVSAIADYIAQGKWQYLADEQQGNNVIIGAGVAKKLGVKLGDTTQLLLPKKQLQQQGSEQLSAKKFPVPLKHTVKIAGIFKFGGAVDESLVYMSHQQAQRLMEYQQDQTQGVRIKVTDVFQAPYLIRDLAYSFDHYVYIFDWTRTQGHLFNDIQLVRVVMFIVLLIVIAVASFNIVSTLIMVVNDKQGDIAILKTMGASSTSIMATFVLQGLVNGVIGCVVGAATGVYLSMNLTEIVTDIEAFFKVKFLSSDVYFIDFLPTELVSQDVYYTVTTALIMSFIATLYPAWRATKIQPAQVLGQI